MKKAFWIIMTLTITSCASLGSRTIYKSLGSIDFKAIGYVNLHYENELNAIFPNTDKIFFKSILYEKPSKTDIVEICSKYNLNGIIVPSLKFIGVTQTVYFIPVGKYVDTNVELKVYNNSGKLIINTSHNT